MFLTCTMSVISGHTSSESDSMSSMDALNKEPGVRKRKSVRRRKGPPRPRMEDGFHYQDVEEIIEPPAPTPSTEV